MLRSVGKTCLAAAYTAARSAGSLTRPASAIPSSPFIICYHRVVENFKRSSQTAIPSMLICTKMFERHLDWLSKRFSIVSLDEIGRHLESDHRFPRPPAAITFDDGYGDVYHHGFPLLKRKGIPAAVFVVTDLVGTGKPQIFDRLYFVLRVLQARHLPLDETVGGVAREVGISTADMRVTSASCEDEAFQVMTLLLNQLPRATVETIMTALEQRMQLDQTEAEELAPLTWGMIETMHRSGITIGSHTKSHALLTSESLEAATRQLVESKTALESRLNDKIRHFAYPDGRFNPDVVRAVNATGYRFAYSICSQRDSQYPLLTIPRKVLWERACLNAWGTFSATIMSCHAHGVFDLKDRCEHDHSIRLGEVNGTIN
jgi:peptidoglycan/xylan/chitin deacetylase (PgdA/CDA1 family)